MVAKATGELVAVVVGLVRAVDRDAEILALLRGEAGELHADLLEVQTGDFFVELLRQNVNTRLVFVFTSPEVELREDLVAEAVRHHERRVAGGATCDFDFANNRRQERNYRLPVL